MSGRDLNYLNEKCVAAWRFGKVQNGDVISESPGTLFYRDVRKFLHPSGSAIQWE
jgi:hypothetical protein